MLPKQCYFSLRGPYQICGTSSQCLFVPWLCNHQTIYYNNGGNTLLVMLTDSPRLQLCSFQSIPIHEKDVEVIIALE